MKTTIATILAAAGLLLASCATDSGSSGSRQHDSMPGMTAEEHAKMKH